MADLTPPLPHGASISVIVPTKNELRNLPRFLASLPPAPVTYDLADVERFFAGDPGG